MSAGAPAKTDPPVTELKADLGSAEDSIALMSELFARHGDVYRVFKPTVGSYTYVIHHPDDVKRVLVSNHQNYVKGPGIDRIKLLLGKGIMTSEGELWTRQRYMMQPFFHRRVVNRFGNLISAANDLLIARWAPLAARGELLNLSEEMSDLTLEIVLSSIFGDDLDRLTREIGSNPFQLITKDSARNLDFVYKFRALTKLLAQLIALRRSEQKERFDFLDMLMHARDRESGAAMSNAQLINEVMTLIVAGHETTASGLTWTWYLLSQHPEVEARLHAEVDAASDLATTQLAQVEMLNYTQQVINEALRLYPPGWLLYRRTIGPDVLGGFTVPPDTNLLVPVYLIHRHPRFWEEPAAFRPERFSAESAAQRPRFAYIPFAAGPRHCIGEPLALFEMLQHVYKVARRYRIAYVPDKPIELEAQINLRSRHPLHVRLEPRT